MSRKLFLYNPWVKALKSSNHHLVSTMVYESNSLSTDGPGRKTHYKGCCAPIEIRLTFTIHCRHILTINKLYLTWHGWKTGHILLGMPHHEKVHLDLKCNRNDITFLQKEHWDTTKVTEKYPSKYEQISDGSKKYWEVGFVFDWGVKTRPCVEGYFDLENSRALVCYIKFCAPFHSH